MSGCLKILLIVAGFLAFCVLVVGIFVWQFVSWVQNMVVPTPTAFAPLALSAGEKEDVQRVIQGLTDAKQKRQEFDEYVTPSVFNGVLEQILQDERKKGKQDVPLGVRIGFEGGSMTFKFSAVANAEQLNAAGKQGATTPYYMNGEAAFDLEVVDGEPKAVKIERLKLGGRETPSVVMWFLRKTLDEELKKNKLRDANGKNPFEAVKLLKREGDRLHVILDGRKIPD